MDVEYHIGCYELNDYVWIGVHILQEMLNLLHCAFYWVSLFFCNGAEGKYDCEINRSCIVEEAADDLLDVFFPPVQVVGCPVLQVCHLIVFHSVLVLARRGCIVVAIHRLCFCLGMR